MYTCWSTVPVVGVVTGVGVVGACVGDVCVGIIGSPKEQKYTCYFN